MDGTGVFVLGNGCRSDKLSIIKTFEMYLILIIFQDKELRHQHDGMMVMGTDNDSDVIRILCDAFFLSWEIFK